MGQLERYGLYVLAIVVMLIVGVAVFGDEQPQRDVVAAESEVPWDGEFWDSDPAYDDPRADSERNPLRRDVPSDRSNEGGLGGIGEGFFTDDDEVDDSGSRRDSDLEDLDPRRGNLSDDRDEPEIRDEPLGEDESGPRGDVEDRVESDRDATSGARHTIRRGDTFEGIARRYYPGQNAVRVSRAIAEANPSVRPTRMQLGTKIVLPVFDGTAPVARNGSGSSSSRGGVSGGAGRGNYKVRAGDTLTAIAQRHYGTTSPAAIEALRGANRNVNPRRLQIGQVLTIPDFQSR